MEKELRQSLLLIALGIFIPLFFFEFAYQQPSYSVELTSTEFELITSDDIKLGKSNSIIQVEYKPTETSKLGNFDMIINTEVSTPHQLTSVYSKDLNYEVTFFWKGKCVAEWDGNYFGSSSIAEANIMYNSRPFPSLTQPMLDVQFKKGLLRFVVSGKYYNSTNGLILSEGETFIDIFISPPFAKIVTFSILFFIICLWYAYVNCVCYSCGKQVQSLRIYRCSQLRCPQCGEYMLHENR